MDFIKGATRAAWLWFADELQLGSWLLPVVPDENATPTPNSKVAKFGKVPSLYDSQGLAHGLTKWTERAAATDDDIDRWSRDGRYSFCVRAGSRSGVYAVDIDVPEPGPSSRVAGLFRSVAGSYCTERFRSDSGKRLLAFRIGGSPPLAKRSFKCDGGIVEFLADGQQFVAAGPHPSRAQYEWVGGLPEGFPEIDRAEFEAGWAALVDEFATETPRAERVTDAASGEEGTLSEITPQELEQLRSALSWQPLIEAADLNDTWAEVGISLLTLGEIGLRLWVDFSAKVDAARGVPRRHSALEWWASHVG